MQLCRLLAALGYGRAMLAVNGQQLRSDVTGRPQSSCRLHWVATSPFLSTNRNQHDILVCNYVRTALKLIPALDLTCPRAGGS